MAAASQDGVLTILAITSALREREQDLRINGVIGATRRGEELGIDASRGAAWAEFLATEYGLLARAIDRHLAGLSSPSRPLPPIEESDQPVRYEKP